MVKKVKMEAADMQRTYQRVEMERRSSRGGVRGRGSGARVRVRVRIRVRVTVSRGMERERER